MPILQLWKLHEMNPLKIMKQEKLYSMYLYSVLEGQWKVWEGKSLSTG